MTGRQLSGITCSKKSRGWLLFEKSTAKTEKTGGQKPDFLV
ncbi:hypothetical protein [Aquimarina sp. TRL1]|nr:hypothetical protein [Aquimarina sp. TRL1]